MAFTFSPQNDPNAVDTFIRAAERGKLRLLQSILDQHLAPGMIYRAMETVVRSGTRSSFDLLLPHLDAQTRDSELLAYAAMQEDPYMLEQLIPRSNPKAIKSRALLWAIQSGRSGNVRRLIPHCAVAAHLENALCMAVAQQSLELVQPFLEPPHHLAEKAQEAALKAAAPTGHRAIFQCLWEVCQRFPARRQALQEAALAEREHILAEFLPRLTPRQQMACVQTLVQALQHQTPIGAPWKQVDLLLLHVVPEVAQTWASDHSLENLPRFNARWRAEQLKAQLTPSSVSGRRRVRP